MIKSKITLQEIKNAIKNNEFIFYYQPKVSMFSGEINAAEALIRWQRPDGEIILPSEFLALAESSGFITTITKIMFQKLVVDMLLFKDISDNIVISFNASSKDFGDSHFIELVKHTIDKGLLNPKQIEIEITESTLLEDKNNINLKFETLSDMGVSLVMDDYGVGFSSIDVLSKFPFSTIKLDQGVISRMEHSNKDKIIVESSIRMGHQLGLDIVAEGIESEGVYLLLQNAGCTIGQGFWMSQPLPLVDFLDLAKKNIRWPSTPAGLLSMAQHDHIYWRKKLIDNVLYIIRNKDFDRRNHLESDAKSCMLGKWYYGLGQQYSGIVAFDELEKPHIQLHELGNKLILAAEKGSSRTQISKMMHELSKLSSNVIKLLQDIEIETL